jgi:hypothetical protein
MSGTVAITDAPVCKRARGAGKRGGCEYTNTQTLSLRSCTLKVVIQSVRSADSERHEDDCSKWNRVSRSRFSHVCVRARVCVYMVVC